MTKKADTTIKEWVDDLFELFTLYPNSEGGIHAYLCGRKQNIDELMIFSKRSLEGLLRAFLEFRKL